MSFCKGKVAWFVGRWLLTSWALVFGHLAFATTQNGPSTSPVTDNLSFVPVLFSLVVVIVAVFVVAYLAKKFNLGISGNRAIKVVSALSLGTRERVVIIEVAGKQHLIGVTAQQVNHLFELDKPIDESTASTHSGDANQDPLTFQKLLQGFKNQKGPS